LLSFEEKICFALVRPVEEGRARWKRKKEGKQAILIKKASEKAALYSEYCLSRAQKKGRFYG